LRSEDRSEYFPGDQLAFFIIVVRALHQGVHDGLSRFAASKVVFACFRIIFLFEQRRMSGMGDKIASIGPKRDYTCMRRSGIEKNEQRFFPKPGNQISSYLPDNIRRVSRIG